jgi:hypothetical protein
MEAGQLIRSKVLNTPILQLCCLILRFLCGLFQMVCRYVINVWFGLLGGVRWF